VAVASSPADFPAPQEEEDDDLLGRVRCKVKGIQHYRGVVENREMGLVEREPGNKYDSNAIRVLNLRREQVGHIQREIAFRIAPLLDKGVVRSGILILSKPNVYELDAELLLFGSLSNLSRLESDLRSVAFRPDTAVLSNRGVEYERRRRGSHLSQTEVDALFAQLGAQEIAAAEQPASVVTEMLPHQLRGLAWMMDRERQLDANVLPPFWSEKTIAGRSGFFFGLSNSFGDARPCSVAGGVLADEMGLGKTLQVLALIADRKSKGPTLVLCPVSVIDNWASQASQHVPRLKVYVFHGSRDRKKSTLEDHDIVIASYATMLADAAKGRKAGLSAVTWARVVCDEAHQVRNADSKAFKELSNLSRTYCWKLTGTPIVNGISGKTKRDDT
jgi:SWI/SNF-related matrix-associated actin-dependent regulator of chromatin subfamily A3